MTRRQPRTVFEHVWAFKFHLTDMCQVELANQQFTFRIERKYSNRTRTIAGPHLPRLPPSYSEANRGITHTESLFAGYNFGTQ